MALAVYVHIPYCLQRCRYCDFATFEFTETSPPASYVEWVKAEIRNRRKLWPHQEIKTLYFGGGTPSLIAPELIVAICRELANEGLEIRTDAEITLEINPATLDEAKLEAYLTAGFNRFSVGAQTFDDRLLKLCNRRHSSADTHDTLRLLAKYKLNYSFDLLFALPTQSRVDLRRDLDLVGEYSPPHLSAYCLTVPEGHPMNSGRAPEGEQIDMFADIETTLETMGLEKYEISNFAKPGFESKHNSIYWNDESFWGIGLSSHSYLRAIGPYGARFWNPKGMAPYERQSARSGRSLHDWLESDQFEVLSAHESLTDYVHVRLRTREGLSEDAVQNKFRAPWLKALKVRLEKLARKDLVREQARGWTLTPKGQLLSNKVFEELCFLASDEPVEALTQGSGDSYCAL